MRLVMLNTGTVEYLFSVMQYSEVKHDYSIGATSTHAGAARNGARYEATELVCTT